MRSESLPGMAMPVRSPFTSAMNTGTPIREKFSAMTCRVTVLPVPVAPVMQPCRLAMAGSKASSLAPDFAMISGSAISPVSLVFMASDSIGGLAAPEAPSGRPTSRLFLQWLLAGYSPDAHGPDLWFDCNVCVGRGSPARGIRSSLKRPLSMLFRIMPDPLLARHGDGTVVEVRYGPEQETIRA